MALVHHQIESTRAALVLLYEAEERMGVAAAGTRSGDHQAGGGGGSVASAWIRVEEAAAASGRGKYKGDGEAASWAPSAERLWIF